MAFRRAMVRPRDVVDDLLCVPRDLSTIYVDERRRTTPNAITSDADQFDLKVPTASAQTLLALQS